MSRFTDYEAVRASGRMNLVWKHELLDESGAVIASTDAAGDGAVWGAELRPLAFQGNRVSQRTAQMSIPISDTRLMPDRPGSWLHPESANRVRIYAGIINESGVAVYWPQATMLADSVTGSYEQGVSTLSVNLVDMTRPLRSELVSAFYFNAGESVEAVVKRLLNPVIPDASIAATGYTTPSGSIEAGQKRDQYVIELLEGCGHELTTDPLGKVFSRLVLPSTGGSGERWRYGQADGLPIASAARTWTVRTPQGWRVEGGSFQNADAPITLTVYDTDPTSEGYFDGTGASQIRTSRLPWVKSTAQAAEAGYAQLRRNGVGPMTIDVTSVPNPALREGDLVDVELDELNASGTFRVIGYQLPIQVDGMMKMTLRKVYDPAVNYTPRVDGDVVCQPSFSDSFDRADENLENLPPGSPGSPDWIEHGWSWGVVGNEAVQRYNNGWCMALTTSPLCAFDQYAEITIGRVPDGKRIGPVIRSTGEYDGVVALCDSNNKISVEYWLNGKHVETLGSENYGSSLVGQRIRLESFQTAVTCYVETTPIVICTTDRGSGTYVGMLGYGGSGSSGPTATAFVSGEF